MPAPFFSIVTAAYNAEEFIEDTIATMLGQTFTDWEWIIINDGSTDRTWEWVTRLTAGHPAIHLYENPRNLGQRLTLNRGLEIAQGKWIGYLHADDGYRAHTLQSVYDYVKDRDDLVLWAHSRMAVGKGRQPDVIVPFKYRTEFTSEDFADLLYLRGCIFGGMSNHLFRRPDPAKGLSFIDGSHSVDLRFWLRYLKAHPGRRAVFHPDVLAYMTEHPDSVSFQNDKSGEWLPDFFSIPRDVADLDWSVSARLRQIARLLKCSIQFAPHMSPRDFLMPLKTIRLIIGSFFRGPAKKV